MNKIQSRTDGKISQRIILLIKNMFDYRNKGWINMSSENSDGPKKVSEFRKEQEDKRRREEEKEFDD